MITTQWTKGQEKYYQEFQVNHMPPEEWAQYKRLNELDIELTGLYTSVNDQIHTKALLWANRPDGSFPSKSELIARYEQEIAWRTHRAETEECDCRDLPDGRLILCASCKAKAAEAFSQELPY